jgi:transcriptional antiterminator NusG
MSDFEKKWYVVRAVSGKEKKVKEYIESEISARGMQDFVAQVLIPTEKIFQVRNGKKISKERSYLPGYVLIEAALIGEIPHIIRNISNVIGFLGAEKKGEPIPLRLSELNIPFVVGENIKVIDGPFNNFSGVIEEVNEEKKKLKVMVKIFGRKTPVELGYMQVEKEQ